MLFRSFNLDLSTPIGDSLNLAYGLEWRDETYTTIAGELASYTGPGVSGMKGITPDDSGDFSRDNFAIYSDLEQDVSENIFDVIRRSFDGTLGAFSYLLFILLYSPCVSALGATHKETGSKWTMFSILWTTFLAYSLSTIVYQFGQISKTPMTAISWISFFVVLHILNVVFLKQWSKRLDKQSQNISQQSASL